MNWDNEDEMASPGRDDFPGLWKNLEDAEGPGLGANQVHVVDTSWDDGSCTWACS